MSENIDKKMLSSLMSSLGKKSGEARKKKFGNFGELMKKYKKQKAEREGRSYPQQGASNR